MTDRLLTAREVGEWLGLSTESVLRRYRRLHPEAYAAKEARKIERRQAGSS